MQPPLKVLLDQYQPGRQARALIRSTPILLLVGPTGAGKDAVKEKLLKTGQFYHIVSHTTRRPRINHGVLEKNDVDYHFINTKQALDMLAKQQFIEAKLYSTNLYGTSVAEIQAAKDQKKVALTDIEVQGVAEYKAIDDKVMAVFLLPPDFKTWQARLRRRYGDVVDAADARRRLKTALSELDQLLNANYYLPVINDSLEATLATVAAIVRNGKLTKSQDKSAMRVAAKLAEDIRAYLEVGN